MLGRAHAPKFSTLSQKKNIVASSKKLRLWLDHNDAATVVEGL